MEFSDLVVSRYSVRKFTNQQVEKEKLESILKAGQAAPTACNKQPQKIMVFQTQEGLELIRKCTMSHFNAPLVILTCYDSNEDWTRDYDEHHSGEIDASIVTTHMMLETFNLGLGCTWVMHFIPEAVITELHLPSNIIPVSLLTIGYPDKDAKPSQLHYATKKLEDIVKYY